MRGFLGNKTRSFRYGDVRAPANSNRAGRGSAVNVSRGGSASGS
jgi:hypothetical protein